jgi:hypothetical protein
MFDSNSTNLLNDQRIVATLLPIESGHTQIKKKKWKKTKKKKKDCTTNKARSIQQRTKAMANGELIIESRYVRPSVIVFDNN